MNAQGINQPQRPPQDLSFAYLTLVIAPWEPTLQRGLYSAEAAPNSSKLQTQSKRRQTMPSQLKQWPIRTVQYECGTGCILHEVNRGRIYFSSSSEVWFKCIISSWSMFDVRSIKDKIVYWSSYHCFCNLLIIQSNINAAVLIVFITILLHQIKVGLSR